MRFGHVILLGFVLTSPSLSQSETRTTPAVTVPGVDPLPQEQITSQEELISFFEQQKKGTPVQLTLDRGKVVRGLFSSYDDYYNTVWVVPQGERGVFTEKAYKVTGIRSVVLLPKKDKPAPADAGKEKSLFIPDNGENEYYLIKENAQ